MRLRNQSSLLLPSELFLHDLRSLEAEEGVIHILHLPHLAGGAYAAPFLGDAIAVAPEAVEQLLLHVGLDGVGRTFGALALSTELRVQFLAHLSLPFGRPLGLLLGALHLDPPSHYDVCAPSQDLFLFLPPTRTPVEKPNWKVNNDRSETLL